MSRKPGRLPKPISIRLDPDVKAAVQAVAEATERSMGRVVRKALREWVDAHQGEIAAARRRKRKRS